MHKLTINLPDKVVELLRSLSAKKGCRVDEYVNELITNHLLEAAATGGHAGKGGLGQSSWQRQGKRKMEPSLPFTVTGKYPGVSKVSLEWAQKFVNEAINLGGVRAFKIQDRVGFEPNFVFIERIYSRSDGFLASFYGSPEDFQKIGLPVRKGWGSSYSRVSVKSESDLDTAIQCLKHSAKLKGI